MTKPTDAVPDLAAALRASITRARQARLDKARAEREHHAGDLDGCQNDGTSCLCECHDRSDQPTTDTAACAFGNCVLAVAAGVEQGHQNLRAQLDAMTRERDAFARRCDAHRQRITQLESELWEPPTPRQYADATKAWAASNPSAANARRVAVDALILQGTAANPTHTTTTNTPQKPAHDHARAVKHTTQTEPATQEATT